ALSVGCSLRWPDSLLPCFKVGGHNYFFLGTDIWIPTGHISQNCGKDYIVPYIIEYNFVIRVQISVPCIVPIGPIKGTQIKGRGSRRNEGCIVRTTPCRRTGKRSLYVLANIFRNCR